MGKAARAGGLLEEILVWEVLVRLPPKALLSCRAVCRAWRSVTSTRKFLLAHHVHQPALPLLDNGSYLNLDNDSIDICCFDHRPGLAAPDRLQSVALLNLGLGDDIAYSRLVASCDGLIIFFVDDFHLFICNPATREHAPLPPPPNHHWTLLGMYPHTPTGEYRLLLYSYDGNQGNEPAHACQVLSLGSGQPPRNVGWPDAISTGIMMELDPPVLFRGNLHWFPSCDDSESKMIMVFDTISELFRQMSPPVVTDCADLFEIDGKLGMAILDLETTIDIWMLQDYEKEVWIFNCRVELPVAEIRVQCNNYDGRLNFHVLVVPGDGELLLLVKFTDWLLQVGMDGKLVSTLHRKEVDATYLQLKQTLVPHTFFPTLEGYVVNAPPFI
ncbi:hypothetical protein CFC21_038074 [Triticum aestivum]|uniref:F-box domain-containing protein n=2 Tax=Triticum aestivum TaxID=4565 RepID=A0A1D5VBN6_WHEAT|nr:hypothetical protein CFC21_038071 [Triticum aestivum]KAF7025924.1 hypothetical protein CFC21_038072 [Triticum aestivum]KAF7025925.1 hypothetical protein CFC21_038073 [Triticum aestivum]KAF7025926.1 hypothetical protein CFC21_038074 [Triticum aestivum]